MMEAAEYDSNKGVVAKRLQLEDVVAKKLRLEGGCRPRTCHTDFSPRWEVTSLPPRLAAHTAYRLVGKCGV